VIGTTHTTVTSPRWPRYVAALLGFTWFLQIGGGPTLNPWHAELIMSGDWMQHWFGWLMFRREPWTFPLGTISGLPYPVGSNVGYTDSNPLVAILLKPFSGVLPTEFQFIGLWLAFCFAMQGYLGAALTSTVTKDARQQLLGGYLFVLSPVLVARIAHDTLCAQFLLLGLLYVGLREYADGRSARRGLWMGVGFTLLAATIHPYLAGMCWVLSQAGFVRLWRARLVSLRAATVAAVATTVGVIAVFGAIGYFGDTRTGASGFGQYSADLLTLVNPDQFSRVLTRFRIPSEQWEGLGFLGLGGIIAVAIATVVFLRRRPALRAGTWAVAAACIAMAIFALSSDIKFAGHSVLSAHPIYDHLTAVSTAFRASGRFVWPLHYLVLLFGIWGATRIFKAANVAAGVTVLAVVVALQATDFRMDSLWAPKDFKQVPVQAFGLAAGKYKHLALAPMQIRGVCTPYAENFVYRYMLHAYRMRLTYNSGVFSRLSAPITTNVCDRFASDIKNGFLDQETIYVVAPDFLPFFQKASAACGRVDGDWICVSRFSDEAFQAYLSK